MDPTMVETWRYLRDHGKPISERDAADYAKIRNFTPPSRALLKRVTRAQLGKDPRRLTVPPRPYGPDTPETLQRRKQLDFHKRVIQSLGGSLTIAAPEYEPPPLQYVESRNGPIQQRTERERLDADGRRMMRESIRARCRMVYEEFQPDMFEVLDAFGSFEAYCRD